MDSRYWTRRRLASRRQVLIGGAGAGLAAAALGVMGCGGGSDGETSSSSRTSTSGGSASSGSAETPKKSGLLRWHAGTSTVSSDPLDPQISAGLAAVHVWPLITDRLVQPDNKTVEPVRGVIIEKWEQPDKSTILLTVRQGVSWHAGKITNGRPYTAADLAWQLDRMSGKLDPERRARFQWSTLINRGFDKAEVVDDTTVKVTFTTPNALFLNGLAYFRQLPVSRETVEKDPDFKNVAEYTGTGAYTITSWDDNARVAKYAANPNYWKKGQPYFETVDHINITDVSARIAAFIAKQFPLFSFYNIDANNISLVKAQRPDAKIYDWEYLGWDYYRLNQSRAPFTDIRVRMATHLAIDRKDLADATYLPGYWDHAGPLPSGLPGTWSTDTVKSKPGWNPDTKRQDIAEAKKLLEAAGFPNGKGITYKIATSTVSSRIGDLAVRIKDQLEKVFPEISIALDAVPPTAPSRLAPGNYDAIFTTSYPPFSAIAEAGQHMRTDGGRNYTKFSDPEIDALVDKGSQEFDANARDQLVGQLEQRILDTVYVIPLAKPRCAFGFDPKLQGVEGYVGLGTSGDCFDPAPVTQYLWNA